MACPTGPSKAELDLISALSFNDGPIAVNYLDYTRTPSAHWSNVAGQTVSVTVTGKTTAVIPLALFSYETQSDELLASFPQKLYREDRVVLNGCETKTLQVAVPSCYYQVDFFYTGNVTEYQIQTSYYQKLPIYGVLAGAKCEPPPPTPTPAPPTTPPTTPTPPALPPVPTTPGTGDQGAASGGASRPEGTKRVCTAVTARSYRVRAKQSNTITVRVKTTSKTRPRVTLNGAGVKTSKKVGSNNTAVFRVRPTRTGSIRVTATGCVKVANVKVHGAKTSQRSGTAPTFTG